MNIESIFYWSEVFESLNIIAAAIFILSLAVGLFSYILSLMDMFTEDGGNYCRKMCIFCIILMAITSMVFIFVPSQKTFIGMQDASVITNNEKIGNITEKTFDVIERKLGEFLNKRKGGN